MNKQHCLHHPIAILRAHEHRAIQDNSVSVHAVDILDWIVAYACCPRIDCFADVHYGAMVTISHLDLRNWLPRHAILVLYYRVNVIVG